MSDAAALPDDIALLKAMVAERNAALAAQEAALEQRDTRIEALEAQLAVLKRKLFGQSSEKLGRAIEQLELTLEEMRESAAQSAPRLSPEAAETLAEKPFRRPLPEHLPREEVVHAAAEACPTCGGALRPLGQDATEVLEFVPGRFKVVRHVRPKLSCRACETIVQAPAPSLSIARGRPGPALLAHVLVSKYADHLPLYRQAQIYARDGVELERSTLADWVGQSAALLDPLVQALARHIVAGPTLHADDTPVPVLAPGTGKTATARLWTYVRDERPSGGEAPPAVLFRFTPDRQGVHPRTHLRDFAGFLHADGYSGFDRLYEGQRITEAACWAHVRRKFFDIHAQRGPGSSPIADEALSRIGALYAGEETIRGRPPDERRMEREAYTWPLVKDLKAWLDATLPKLSGKSDLAKAIRYALSRWEALGVFLGDGRVEIDNNAAERALRAVALGRKNWLFAGSDAGGARAAAIYSLAGTAKLCGLDPELYLRDVLARIADHPIVRIGELLPWRINAAV
jgi:transposase